jgi:phytoene dehydrogenase-like protein
VQGLERDGGGWILRTRRETVRADRVFANVLPQALGPLAGLPERAVRRRARRVESGWSACMLYLSVDEGCPLGPAPLHFEIVQDPGAPLDGGNHLLVSLGPTGDAERAPAGRRVATVSTHIDPKRYAADPAGVANLAQQRLRDGLAAHLPEVAEHIAMEMTGSPRTFERFTRRPGGLVGGVPRRAGLDHSLDLFPRPVAPGLHLVGDSALLGQSVLATALGGQRAAPAALRGWAPGRRGARTPHRPHDPADSQDESR